MFDETDMKIEDAINEAGKEYSKLIDVVKNNGDKKTAFSLVSKLVAFAKSHDDFVDNDEVLGALDTIKDELKDNSSKNELLADIDTVGNYIFDVENVANGDN